MTREYLVDELRRLEIELYRLKREFSDHRQMSMEFGEDTTTTNPQFQSNKHDREHPGPLKPNRDNDLRKHQRRMLRVLMHDQLDRLFLLMTQIKEYTVEDPDPAQPEVQPFPAVIAEIHDNLTVEIASEGRRLTCRFLTSVPETLFIDRARFVETIEQMSEILPRDRTSNVLEIQFAYEPRAASDRLLVRLLCRPQFDANACTQAKASLLEEGLGSVTAQRMASSINGFVSTHQTIEGCFMAVLALDLPSQVSPTMISPDQLTKMLNPRIPMQFNTGQSAQA